MEEINPMTKPQDTTQTLLTPTDKKKDPELGQQVLVSPSGQKLRGTVASIGLDGKLLVHIAAQQLQLDPGQVKPVERLEDLLEQHRDNPQLLALQKAFKRRGSTTQPRKKNGEVTGYGKAVRDLLSGKDPS